MTHAITHDPNTGPTTQPRPKHRTQPRPTTPFKHRSQPKTTTTTDPRRHPRPKHRTHNPTTTQTPDPQPNHNPNTGPNREGRERRDGVWVRREERAEMEKQRREGRERKELKLERKNRRGIKYIYILTYCYSTILSLELYCSIIAKIFAIVRFTIVWCKCFWTLKCQKCLKYSISILQC